MSIFARASALDFDGWFKGILSAGISGGASAVAGSIILPALDAKDFNVYTSKFYIAIGALFIASGLVSVSKFLAAQPIPGLKTVTTTVEKTVQQSADPAITMKKTVQEVHQEPIDPKKG